MRIAIIGELYEKHPGGIELHGKVLSSSLAELGHSVFRVSDSRFREAIRSSPDWIIFEGVHRSKLFTFIINRNDTTSGTALFVHGSFFEFQHFRTLFALGGIRNPVAVMLKRAFDLLITRHVLTDFDFVFTYSNGETADVRRLLKLRPERVRELSNFVVRTKSAMPTKQGTNRWQSYKPYVCAIARIHRWKNFVVVLDAIKNLPLTFLLSGTDDGDLTRLLAHSRASGLSNFHYVGILTDAEQAELIDGSIGTVLPSISEGMPFGVIESLMRGKPAISTKNTYLNRFDGVIFVSPTVDSVRSGLMRLIENPPEVERPNIPAEHEISQQLVGLLSRLDR